MKKLSYLLLLLLPFLISCNDNCEGIDCLSEDAFAFTIKSRTSGNDLLFGSNKQLTENDVKVYYFANGTKQTPVVRFDNSYVLVGLNREVREYFVVALGQTDTVRVETSSVPSSECCPSTTAIESITVNGADVAEGTWIIDLYR